MAAHSATHRGQGRRRRTANGGGGGNTTLALKEFWGSAKAGITTVDCKPLDSLLPKLVNLAAIYETYKLVSWSVHVVHTGGVNSAGSYFMGVSYRSDKHPTDQRGVASLAPVVCKSINTDATISVPTAKLMGQPWLDSSAPSPGAVMIFNDSQVALQVWVTYRVVFNGPTSVAQVQQLDALFKFDNNKRTWEDSEGNRVTQVSLDFGTYGDLEINGEEGALETCWRVFTSVARSAHEVHRVWNISLGVIHFVMDAVSFSLPVLNVPAVLHLQRRPFRTSDSEWIRLGGRVSQGSSQSSLSSFAGEGSGSGESKVSGAARPSAH